MLPCMLLVSQMSAMEMGGSVTCKRCSPGPTAQANIARCAVPAAGQSA